MMAEEFDAKKVAEQIYRYSGGVKNVESFENCMTRIRLEINDHDQIDEQKLKEIPGVLGVVNDEQLQVVVGPGKVNKVEAAMEAYSGEKGINNRTAAEERAKEVKAEAKKKQKQSPFKSLLKDIANIFVPMIPAFVGSGLIAGIAAIISNLITNKTLTGETWNQIALVLNVIKAGMFTYLPIYTGINAARVWKATPTLGGVIGAVILLTGMDPNAPIKNLFTGAGLTANQGGILGVIFAVWLLSVLEKKLHQWVPDSIDIIVTPMICLLVIGLAELFVIMPLAGFISDGLIGGINWILNVGGAFSGFILGALFLPMVMLGLHQILTPIHVQMISQTGNTPLLPILAMAGGGQVGAAAALWLRLRHDRKLVDMIKGSLPVGILGIGEPLIYAVTLPLGRPFITACIGGGIGGAVIGAIGKVGAIAIGPSGLPLIPLIDNHRWWAYVLGLLAAYIGGFIVTYFWGIPTDKLAVERAEAAAEKEKNVRSLTGQENDPDTPTAKLQETTLQAVATGELKPISEAQDPVFAQKSMGEGYVLLPSGNEVYAPAAGTISSVFPTKHALGFTTETGIEILLHLGIDTVDLKGVPFDVQVTEGQQVAAGDLLVKADWQAVIDAGKLTETIVALPELGEAGEFELGKTGKVTAKEQVATIKSK
ncbi:sucrose-specific PTS system IIABC component [Ligilactobacillus salitolerans]|uniref:Sucrose-specific PTS system IIABC component n=1 Tax=Ligilactobacillus salitolerans TaxID=1808352 RepID=A0A401IVQ9_9LACO|nr:sucrose-specific PTS system IIABC component [Ligilactobacillus salitolerans]